MSFTNFKVNNDWVMMKKTFLQLLPLLLFFLPIVLLSQEIYVSKKGNDNNPGTKMKPHATHEAARDL